MSDTLAHDIIITQKKKRRFTKPRDNDFTIPQVNDYNQFINTNYPVSFLKDICKNYGLKSGGNKPDLKNRIYKFLYQTCMVIIIQKIYKGHLVRLYNKLIGPAFFDRSLCKNDTDFFTLESIKTISIHNFFSYKYDNGIWGFDILSIYNLFVKTSSGIVLNPYTREKLDNSIFINIKHLIRLAKIFHKPVNIILNDSTNQLSTKKKNEIKCLELFQHINELGNYSDYMWFMNLSHSHLVKFIRELVDIWEYRAQLTPEIKRDICPPYGDPFRYSSIHFINSLGYTTLQKTSLQIIEHFIKKGLTRDSCVLGASYILCALTLVNHEAAIALPWLYHSVSGTG
jgi:hypothetical protein